MALESPSPGPVAPDGLGAVFGTSPAPADGGLSPYGSAAGGTGDATSAGDDEGGDSSSADAAAPSNGAAPEAEASECPCICRCFLLWPFSGIPIPIPIPTLRPGAPAPEPPASRPAESFSLEALPVPQDFTPNDPIALVAAAVRAVATSLGDPSDPGVAATLGVSLATKHKAVPATSVAFDREHSGASSQLGSWRDPSTDTGSEGGAPAAGRDIDSATRPPQSAHRITPQGRAPTATGGRRVPRGSTRALTTEGSA